MINSYMVEYLETTTISEHNKDLLMRNSKKHTCLLRMTYGV